MSYELKEGIKEAGRFILISVYGAIVPAMLTFLTLPAEQIEKLLSNHLVWIGALAFVLAAALKGLDKYMHKMAPTGKSGGLSNF